jgi:hypothetical protein
MLDRHDRAVHRSGKRCITCHIPHRWKA